jgi:hypothetical protein
MTAAITINAVRQKVASETIDPIGKLGADCPSA